MIQELWKQNITWDQELTNDCKQQWLKWLHDIENLKSLQIPRRYFNNDVTNKQLHIFCDSSQQAYGAVAYLRGTSGNKVYTCLLMAKTRVAPVKSQTLPRLELLASSTRRSKPISIPRKNTTAREGMRNYLLE
ncbi:hypothetical protein QZH41_007505 [Actinostola sp. cb2023]|nr:hypothetical protein QZH41_007505 [Actinostola sp. cb2023]